MPDALILYHYPDQGLFYSQQEINRINEGDWYKCSECNTLKKCDHNGFTISQFSGGFLLTCPGPHA